MYGDMEQLLSLPHGFTASVFEIGFCFLWDYAMAKPGDPFTNVYGDTMCKSEDIDTPSNELGWACGAGAGPSIVIGSYIRELEKVILAGRDKIPQFSANDEYLSTCNGVES